MPQMCWEHKSPDMQLVFYGKCRHKGCSEVIHTQTRAHTHIYVNLYEVIFSPIFFPHTQLVSHARTYHYFHSIGPLVCAANGHTLSYQLLCSLQAPLYTRPTVN